MDGTNTMMRGVFVGRFQPVHNGHLELIKEIVNKVDELVIVVGSSQYSHKRDNPFTAGERVTMIRNALQESQIPLSKTWIIPVPDVHHHSLWVAQIVSYCPRFDVVYTNEPLTGRLFTEAGFKVEHMPLIKRELYTSTEVRERIQTGRDWEKLVPSPVAKFIKEINGDVRVRELNKTDKLC